MHKLVCVCACLCVVVCVRVCVCVCVCVWKCRSFVIIAIGSRNDDAVSEHDLDRKCAHWCFFCSVGVCVFISVLGVCVCVLLWLLLCCVCVWVVRASVIVSSLLRLDPKMMTLLLAMIQTRHA